MSKLRTAAEIEKQREACHIVREVHDALREKSVAGVTLAEINRIAEDIIRKRGAVASFRGKGFPGAVCASVNEVVIHGLPTDYSLKDGDILSVDVGAYKNGFHGDAARTLMIGDVSHSVRKLVEVTEQSYFEGIKQFKLGGRVGDISSAIQRYVEPHGFGIVKAYTGHGVGRELHESPEVPNFGAPNAGKRLKRGMVLAIEPMVNMGTHAVKVLDDGWTVVTADGQVSAHYENTAVLTENGVDILTL